MVSAPRLVAADACFLINFLAVDQLSVLSSLADEYRFVAPLEVVNEVRRPAERNRLEASLQLGVVEAVEITDPAELASLTDALRSGLGDGECACLALAECRGWLIASDERGRFRRVASDKIGIDRVITTPSVLALLVEGGHVAGGAARAMAAELRASHRFAMAVPDDW